MEEAEIAPSSLITRVVIPNRESGQELKQNLTGCVGSGRVGVVSAGFQLITDRGRYNRHPTRPPTSPARFFFLPDPCTTLDYKSHLPHKASPIRGPAVLQYVLDHVVPILVLKMFQSESKNQTQSIRESKGGQRAKGGEKHKHSANKK